MYNPAEFLVVGAMIGVYEVILILVVVVLIFGAKRIPEIARALGRASREFKNAKDEIVKNSKDLMDEAEKAAEVEDELAAKKKKAIESSAPMPDEADNSVKKTVRKSPAKPRSAKKS